MSKTKGIARGKSFANAKREATAWADHGKRLNQRYLSVEQSTVTTRELNTNERKRTLNECLAYIGEQCIHAPARPEPMAKPTVGERWRYRKALAKWKQQVRDLAANAGLKDYATTEINLEASEAFWNDLGNIEAKRTARKATTGAGYLDNLNTPKATIGEQIDTLEARIVRLQADYSANLTRDYPADYKAKKLARLMDSIGNAMEKLSVLYGDNAIPDTLADTLAA